MRSSAHAMLPVTKTLCVFVKGSRWRCLAGREPLNFRHVLGGV